MQVRQQKRISAVLSLAKNLGNKSKLVNDKLLIINILEQTIEELDECADL